MPFIVEPQTTLRSVTFRLIKQKCLCIPMSYVADSEESASFDKNYKSKFAKPFVNEKALSFEVVF